MSHLTFVTTVFHSSFSEPTKKGSFSEPTPVLSYNINRRALFGAVMPLHNNFLQKKGGGFIFQCAYFWEMTVIDLLSLVTQATLSPAV